MDRFKIMLFLGINERDYWNGWIHGEPLARHGRCWRGLRPSGEKVAGNSTRSLTAVCWKAEDRGRNNEQQKPAQKRQTQTLSSRVNRKKDFQLLMEPDDPSFRQHCLEVVEEEPHLRTRWECARAGMSRKAAGEGWEKEFV